MKRPAEHPVSQPIDPAIVGKPAWRRFVERATIMGLLFSLAVHLVILLIAAIVTVNFGSVDAGGDSGDEVGFAVLTDAQLAQMQSPRVTQESFEVAAIPTEAMQIDLLSDTSNEDSVNELADSLAPSLSPGGGSLTSFDPSTGAAGAGTGDGASFFGLEAKGRRFAYIVDISGSMNTLTGQGAFTRWELTRAELIRSIDALEQHTQFAIVLYSTNAVSVFGQGNWTEASRGNKRWAATTLQNYNPVGGTNPLPGFDIVFKLDPDCDAIYFMTDGLFNLQIPNKIKQLNRHERIPIHTILFGELANPSESTAALNMMREIARSSGGRFTHVREGRP